MAEKSIRDRIIQTSLRLFEENGYHRVTVDRIVKESSTSKGGFYHNFQSKDELLFTIHDQFISYVIEKGQEAYRRWKTPTERLHAMIKSFVTMVDIYRSEVTVFYQESYYLAPEYFKEIECKRDRYKELMFEVIREGVQCGEFRKELPVPIVSMAIFGMVNWIYKWYQNTGEYSIAEIADIYSDMILHSVLTPEAKENPVSQYLFLKMQQVDNNPNKLDPFKKDLNQLVGLGIDS